MSDALRVLGLFDHAGVDRGQRNEPRDSRVPGPYRIDLLREQNVDLHTVAMPKWRSHVKVRDVIEHRTHVRVDLALRGSLVARKSDAVLAVLEDKVVLPSLSRRSRLSPYASARLAVVSCWWAEELRTGGPEAKDRIAHVLERVDDIFVFSRNQVEIFETVGAGHKVVPVTFGVDHHSFRPVAADVRPNAVFSAGVDRGRDFVTLVRAAAQLPDVEFTILTQEGRLQGEPVPANVKLARQVSGGAYRQAIHESTLVVIPTHELAYPTGQSVLLEAMASGKATMVTDTDAMSEYIEDGNFNFSMPAHNPDGVATKIADALSQPQRLDEVGHRARLAVEERFNFDRTWSQVASHLRSSR